MTHHAAQAFFVAPHTALDLFRMIADHLAGPGRVGDHLAAHGGAVDPALGQLLLHKIRPGQAAHGANGQRGIPADQIAIRQEAAFSAKIRMPGRRNGKIRLGKPFARLFVLDFWAR